MTLGTRASLAANAEGDFGKARAFLLEGRERTHRMGDSWAEGMTAFNLGVLAYRQGDYLEAQARYDESHAIWESMGDRVFMHLPTSGLADVARRTGNYDQAVALYREMVSRWQQAGNVGAIARCMECLAFVAVARGDGAQDRERLRQHAARLLGAAETLRVASTAPMMPDERSEYDPIVGQLLGTPGQPTRPGVSDAWHEGRAMTRAQAVEYALRSDGE
jgi:tetratricopeptide (TPR) repeat protein